MREPNEQRKSNIKYTFDLAEPTGLVRPGAYSPIYYQEVP